MSVAAGLSRKIGGFYERGFGRSGDIKRATDIFTSPGQVAEDIYKHSPGYYTGKVLRPGTPTLTIPPETPPTATVPGYASEAEKQKRKRRKGYGSSILAGGELGVSAATQRKQILG